MRRTFLKLAAATLVGAALSASAFAADPAKKEITFGTTVGDFGDMVRQSIKPQLEKKGYTVKLVEFTDYVRPNLALAEGAIDVNIFQHRPYLDNFAREHKLSLTPVAQVPTGPLGLYSGKLKALNQVKAGSTVAVPNDPTNMARALVMLADAGWITLKPGIDPLRASEKDIAENLKQVKIVQLEAAQLPRARADVDFAVINGNYAASSGIKFTEGLFLEKGYTFVNVVVTRSADVNKPFVKDVVAAYNSPEFKQYAKRRFAGYKFPQGWN